MILTVTLNPCVDLILFVDGLKASDTNRVKRTEKDAGGKGINVARVARELGCPTRAAGWLGGGFGAYVEKVLKDQGVECGFVWIQEETRMNVSVEDGSGRPPTTLNVKGPATTPGDWEALMESVSRLAQGASWVCLGGSLPPNAPADAWRILCLLGREAGAKVVLDADGEPMKEGMKAGPDLIKPNRAEAERLLGRSLETREDAAQAARQLLGALGEAGSSDPTVILSLGADGAVLAARDRAVYASPAPVEVVSTIGSGDSLIGGYLAGLTSGRSIEESFALGSAAGAATAATDGTEIARRPVVERLLPLVEVVQL